MVILNVSLSLPTKSDGDIALVSIRMFIHLKVHTPSGGHRVHSKTARQEKVSGHYFFLL